MGSCYNALTLWTRVSLLPSCTLCHSCIRQDISEEGGGSMLNVSGRQEVGSGAIELLFSQQRMSVSSHWPGQLHISSHTEPKVTL